MRVVEIFALGGDCDHGHYNGHHKSYGYGGYGHYGHKYHYGYYKGYHYKYHHKHYHRGGLLGILG